MKAVALSVSLRFGADDPTRPAAGRSPAPFGDRSEDRELTARCVAGDPSAQRELFDRERPHVASVCARLAGGGQAVDDLVQEVFCAVFRDLRRFRGESALATWVDRIAVRTALLHVRRRRARERVESSAEGFPDAPDVEQPSVERRALDREVARRAHRALDALDVDQREAFALHVLEGNTVQQIAALMRCSVVAAKARIWRARRALRRRAARDPALAEYVDAGPAPAEDAPPDA